MTNEQLKAWAQFYLRLIGTEIVNGFFRWLGVIAGSTPVTAGAQLAGLIDVRAMGWSVGWKLALLTLAGSVVASVAAALVKNLLPDPAPPTAPAS